MSSRKEVTDLFPIKSQKPDRYKKWENVYSLTPEKSCFQEKSHLNILLQLQLEFFRLLQ